jgi:glycosyltransferase involved in cell wall biosynthesis
MSATFHLLTGEYAGGGVGDYTRLLARALASHGAGIHVWSPAVVDGVEDGVRLRRLPDTFGSASRQVLGDALDRARSRVIVQYVPNAFGARGANLAFCRWLRARGRSGDVRVMFHEPYFYFSWSPARNALAVAQRLMARELLHAGRVMYLSTDRWLDYLRPLAPSGTQFTTLPIPATVPDVAPPAAVARWRARFADVPAAAHVVGHFGSFGEHMTRELRALVPAVLDANATAAVACIGRNSERFVGDLCRTHPALDARIHATGDIAAGDVAAALRACDVAVQPYPDGATTRRTSLMAALANGVPTVTTDGPLTEQVWRTAGVRLAPAGDATSIARAVYDVLHDAPARAALGAAGRDTYDARFALSRSIAHLLEDAAAPA